ncbi:hypothetical protein NDU88_006900 [Pleurodeles waltl]|uniref:Uncharacterized protein n=1 Tax=Pleurodeles waltl TaxID=8319 RepID=A0AAV7RMU3_PLEWA|nr:hypothetical protein NDU88_006900 [Pleurodeles waltl]
MVKVCAAPKFSDGVFPNKPAQIECARPIFTNPAHQYPGGTIASQGNGRDVPQPRTNPDQAQLLETNSGDQKGGASAPISPTEGRQSEEKEWKTAGTGPLAGEFEFQWKLEMKRRRQDEESRRDDSTIVTASW